MTRKRTRLFATTALVASALITLGAPTPVVHAANGDLQWARQLGGSNTEFAYAMAVDGAGDVLTTGAFISAGDYDPGPGTFNMTPTGGADAFVSKLDAAGNFVWARQFPSGGVEAGHAIATDAAGNVYSAGNFDAGTDFDPGAPIAELTPVGGDDVYISKLNADGNFVWARRVGGSNFDGVVELLIDSSNNVYVVGTFQGTVDFDPGAGTVNMTSANSGAATDSYILKLDSAGLFVSAAQFGGQYVQAQKAAIDNAANVYIAGNYIGAINDFDPGAGTVLLPSAGGGYEGFVIRLDPAGNLVWARHFEGAGTATTEARGVGVDTAGNVYVSGYTAGTVDTDPGAGTENFATDGLNDIFVVKLDASGLFQWSVQLGGSLSDLPLDLAVDALGNSYTAGYFTGNGVDFDPGLDVDFVDALGGTDIFVWSLDTDGNLNWRHTPGSTNSDQAETVAVDAGGGVHVAGYFGAATDFDAGPGTTTLSPGGSLDAFVYKLTGHEYASVVPKRLLDTRVGGSTVDDLFEGIGIRGAGSTTELQVTGRAGIPADAEAVALNITAAGALGDGFITVYPCGSPFPTASNLNFLTGDAIPNLVITQIGVDGKVCIYTYAATHLLADVNGFYPVGSAYNPLVPGRLLDTRFGAKTVDNNPAFQGIGERTAGSIFELQVTGRGGVPADAQAAVLNVTAAGALDDGFITVYPCGSPLPTASNLNFLRGDAIPNLVIAQIGGEGKVCIYTYATTHVLVDVDGFFPAATTYEAMVPERLLDSRVGGETIDHLFEGTGINAAGSTVELQVAGRGTVPADATTAVLNVTAAGALGDGFITVYPCGSALPTASNLNYFTGDTIPNLVVTQIGDGGKVCIYTYAATHLIADVSGYF